MMLAFEWTFRAGDITTVIAGLAVASAFLYRKGGDETAIKITLKSLTAQLAEMKTEFRTFGETLKTVAVQEVKIGLLMKWYDELRNGHGYIDKSAK